jgi:competence protein ComEC
MTGTEVYLTVRPGVLVLISGLLWVVAVILFTLDGRRPGSAPGLFSLQLFLLFYMTGMGSGYLSDPADPLLPVSESVVIRGEITGSPVQERYSRTFDMELHMLCSGCTARLIRTNLKVHLTDSLMPVQGEIWQFRGNLVPVSNSGNPGAPDFRSIMGRKSCWYRFYVAREPVPSISNRKVQGKGRKITSAIIRRAVSDHWKGAIEEVSLLKAICLGDRSTLTDEMRQDYTASGGMHLLAVSGLHVGLIWWVLQYITGWIRLLFRIEKERAAVVLGLLWFYAFGTGFSSSVCRSVTMFTFFTASRLLGQRIHSMNGILVSALILVIIDPVKLMDLGFQLSYAAITGIIALYPLARRVVRVKNKVLRWVLEASALSLSAQLATAPLVIFYFHQLPLYSIFTSLFAIPMLSLIITLFVLSVPFILTGNLEQFFNFLLIKLAHLMNIFMNHLSSTPGALLEGLTMDRVTLIIWLLVLLFFMIGFNHRTRIPWYLVLFLSASSLVWNSLSGLSVRSSRELVITNFSGASMVIIRDGTLVDQYCWYRDTASAGYLRAYSDIAWNRRVYESNLIEVGDIPEINGQVSSCRKVAEGLWLLGGEDFIGLVVRESLTGPLCHSIFRDTTGYYPEQPRFILFSGEPFVDCLPDINWKGETDIIMDGSNRRWYREKMEAEWTGIFLTDRSGAYMKRW